MIEMNKKNYLKKWASLVIDMAWGDPDIDADDMDLSVGLAMVIHMAVQAHRGLDCEELKSRVEMDFDMEELIEDTKEVYPRRFEWE